MDTFVLRWRALTWGRVWFSVLVLTLAWSIGAGLGLRAVSPAPEPSARNCRPVDPRPLIAAPSDWLWLPYDAMIAAPYGVYESGLQFAVVAFAVLVIPAASLQQGTARRVLGAPVIVLLGAVLLWTGWTYELHAVRVSGVLPSLVCSN